MNVVDKEKSSSKCRTVHEKVPSEKNARFMYPGMLTSRENLHLPWIKFCIIGPKFRFQKVFF